MDKIVMNNTGLFAVQNQPNAKFTDSQAKIDYQVYALIFTNTYNYAMDLIERMSAYIEGPGRLWPQSLAKDLSEIYASEAMSSTTRLMQIAAWLLLMRSAIEGDISFEESVAERKSLCLNTDTEKYTNPAWERLPIGLCKLIDESLDLEARLRVLNNQLDKAQTKKPADLNHVLHQQQKLQKTLNI